MTDRAWNFPFAAVVGMDDVKLALLLGAVEPLLGGVLLRGEKGSAKTTLARGLAELLPGSPPFVELPLGATEDRVVGTLDLAAALRAGERQFHPGLLHAVDGGVLYVDEVNLLADHLVDVLLDVSVSGVNRVEREGVSHAHRSRFLLVGSMNPEEGELRPQLLDRFGLSVEVSSPERAALRAEAVRRRLAFDSDPATFSRAWTGKTEELRRSLAGYAAAALPAEVLEQAAGLAAAVGADGLRADLALCRAAAALAGLEGGREATGEHLRRVAPLALAHRRRRGPFDDPGVSPEEIEEALGTPPPAGGSGARAERGRGDGAPSPSGPEEPPLAAAGDPEEPARPPDPSERAGRPRKEEPGGVAPISLALPPQPRAGRALSPTLGETGRSRSGGPTASYRGRVIGSRPLAETGGRVAGEPRIAALPTVLAAAARRASAAAGAGEASAALLEPGDLQEALTEESRAHLVVLCVDASGSMGAAERVAAARSAVLGLLTDAYERRDRVAVVCFSGSGASVVLRPTGSVEVARQRLDSVPTGGRTPLAEGIAAALDLLAGPAAAGLRPVLVLVSDGRATAAPAGTRARRLSGAADSPGGSSPDPVAAALEVASRVRSAGVPALVVDVESGGTRLGLARRLAEAMGARHVALGQPDPGRLRSAISEVLS